MTTFGRTEDRTHKVILKEKCIICIYKQLILNKVLCFRKSLFKRRITTGTIPADTGVPPATIFAAPAYSGVSRINTGPTPWRNRDLTGASPWRTGFVFGTLTGRHRGYMRILKIALFTPVYRLHRGPNVNMTLMWFKRKFRSLRHFCVFLPIIC